LSRPSLTDKRLYKKQGMKYNGEVKSFFYPGSVVIIGVSNSPSNLGRSIAENLERFRFKGSVYLVGQKTGYLKGKRIFSNIEELDTVPDLAILLTPADTIVEMLDNCGRKGIHRAIIETAGFSELGEEKKALEKEIINRALKWNMKFIGPNCIGIINMENSLALPFVPFGAEEIKNGHISIISQSGGIIHETVRRACIENLGLNKLISIGNKLMVDEDDLLEFLISDPTTLTIGIYLENITRGKHLMGLAQSTDKPIIFLKANASPAGREIAKFHTSALFGDNLVAEAALREAGIHRVQDLEEMINCYKIFTLPAMKGPKVAMVARSGGLAVILADTAYRYHFKLSRFSQDLLNTVRRKTRAGVIRLTNPLDLGDLFDVDFYIEIVEQILQETDVDGMVFFHSYGMLEDFIPTQRLIKSLHELSYAYRKPVVLCVAPDKENWFKIKELTDFPIFSGIDSAFRALYRSFKHFEYRSKQNRPVSPTMVSIKTKRKSNVPSGIMDTVETFELLRSYNFRIADYRVAKNNEAGSKAAGTIGYPVALKVVRPFILHKTDNNGVKLNIGNDNALRDAFNDMQGEEYIVQKMIPAGYETIIGGKQDIEFGPVVLFGLGGIFAEVFKNISIRLAPIDEETARKMIEETSGGVILKGYRGQPPSDINDLSRCLVNLSRLLFEHPEIINIDINPLIVLGNGNGCQVVDAKIKIL